MRIRQYPSLSRHAQVGAHLLLPGRSRWIPLCHTENFPACPHCAAAIGFFLAEEMGFDVLAALDRPATAYAAELDVAGMSGWKLRHLVVLACLLKQHGTAPTEPLDGMIVADEVAA